MINNLAYQQAMKAFIFPGQGAQFTGMGLDLYNSGEKARNLFSKADEVLGFPLSEIIFHGSEDELRQTRATQPAVFVHSVISALCSEDQGADAVAGHSLGEFSALCYAGALAWEDALRLVYARALAMQRCCEKNPGAMAAVMGLEEEALARVLSSHNSTAVIANFNCPGQLVISGSVEAIRKASEACRAAGAKKVVLLPVSGAFHSPLMQDAAEEFAKTIEATEFRVPRCPVYQNVDGAPHRDPAEIRENLLRQLTSPVLWTTTVRNMRADGIDEFVEFGPGNVLSKLIRRI